MRSVFNLSKHLREARLKTHKFILCIMSGYSRVDVSGGVRLKIEPEMSDHILEDIVIMREVILLVIRLY